MIVTHDLRLPPTPRGAWWPVISLKRPRRGTRIVSKGAPSQALVPPRLGTAGRRHSGRLAPAPALAAQHAHSEALDLAPNNSLEPTRPARCLIWRDTNLALA